MHGQPGRFSTTAMVLALMATWWVAPAAPAAVAAGPAIDWHRCGDGFQCGSLPVPVDYARPASPTIDLAVIRQPARRSRSRLGAIVVNPGGPGAPAVAYLRSLADVLPNDLRDRFDLVAFDPRGVGASSPIRCGDGVDPLFDQAFSPERPEERAALLDAFRRVATACMQHDAGILAHVSTREGAHDLDRLRAALGEPRLTFLGLSYGTYLGTLYASAYPRRVRAMVLDGVIDPALDAEATALAQARGFEHALDDFLADCAAHPGCPYHHGGHPAGAYDRLRARVARLPIPAPETNGRTLNQTRFDAAVLHELYLGRAGWSTLARALAAAERGDASGLLDMADTFVGRQSDGTDDHSLEAFWAVRCLDGPAADVATMARIEARAVHVAPRIGAFVVNMSLACSVWPVAALPSTRALRASGAPAILVVGTTDDPATPLSQARSLARELDRGVLLVARGEQHTAFVEGNACVDRVVTHYLVDREPPKDGTRC